MIRSQTAGSNDAMDMGMKLQALIPAMEHTEETDFSPEMPRITSDFKQCVSAGMEQQVVDEPFVLQRERSQVPRQSEYGMDIGSGQQFSLARLEPASARVALASWAMPVSARVVGDGVVCPQPVQWSRWPPSAAVRQRKIASRIFRCCQLIHLRLRSINACPAQRTMSAISTRGRLFNCAFALPVK